jgi:site-specific recombinase XerD
LRIRDIRRSTGSWLTINGENLKTVQAVLGHTSMEVTAEHYSHLDLTRN